MQEKIKPIFLYLITVFLILLLIGGCVRSPKPDENTSENGQGDITYENETLNFDI